MFYFITLLCTPIGALVSASVIGTPSASKSFWKERTGANTPASHTVPRLASILIDQLFGNFSGKHIYFLIISGNITS